MIFMVGDKSRYLHFGVDPGRTIGFDMSAMKEEVYGEAIIDVVKPESVISTPVVIKVCESAKTISLPPNEPFTFLFHVGHIRPRRTASPTQFPILLLPRLHHNKTHKDPHLRVIL